MAALRVDDNKIIRFNMLSCWCTPRSGALR